MIYSAACGYAIRALCRLSILADDGYVSVQQICEGTDLPVQFIAKIFGDLVRRKLLISAKGPGGGFALARPIKDIRLYDIVEAVDGVDHLHQCVVGLSACNSEQPCPQHETFAPLRRRIVDYLQATNLDQISDALTRKLEILGRSALAADTSTKLRITPNQPRKRRGDK